MKNNRSYSWHYKGVIIHLYENDIYYVQREGRNVFVHTHSRSYIIGRDLSRETQQLSAQIVQIHRSYFINLRHLEAVYGYEVVLRNGVHLPVSKNRKKQVRAKVLAYASQLESELQTVLKRVETTSTRVIMP